MSNELDLINPEQQKVIATDIYNSLQRQRGTTRLSGFNRGEVIRLDLGRRIMVVRQDDPVEFVRNDYKEAGFTDEDIDSGMNVFMEYEYLNPTWTGHPLIHDSQLHFINISATGKVIELSDGKETPVILAPHQVDAVQRISVLSIIPRQIAEIFGDYDEFIEQLGHKDMRGIDSVEWTPTQIMYQGGLKKFVRALELKEKGELGKLDTALHDLRDSLDKRDHFTKLAETLNRLHQG